MGKQSRRPARQRTTVATCTLTCGTVAAAAAVALTSCCLSADPSLAFVPAHPLASCTSSSPKGTCAVPLTRRYLSDDVGGGLGDRPPPGGGGGNGGGRKGGKMDDFFDKEQNPESDNLRQARERMAEDSLPLSFGFERSAKNSDDDAGDDEANEQSASANKEEGGKLSRAAPGGAIDLQNNPYLEVVSRLSPSDLISKFTSTAHPRVQDAVRTTILGLIGNLPKMAFDTTTITTGERLASLMFQLQMTGYMFKNSEYRLSLSESLGMDHLPTGPGGMAQRGRLLEGTLSPHGDDEDDDGDILSGEVKGKIRVKYGGGGGSNSGGMNGEEDSEDGDNTGSGLGGMEVEVDAAAYMSELRDEVARLKEELSATRKSKDDAIKKDLLLYIRTMPKEELASLTNTITPEVLAAMKGLVSAVMNGIGEGKKIEPNTITEQSGEAMAQLCMWQLVVGYNLRELEVREEMRAALTGSPREDGKDENGRTWYGSG